jgi:hypothetical protein
MATEKTIGLRIQLNGVNAVVKDIKTFEDEIRKAKEDLKEVQIGSKIFNQLAQEIGLAESQLLGLITSTKRLTKEREIEGIGKLGQGIASSFAAATAAVSLFGNESEDVQKAATAAQNLLTLALSARGIAEIKLGAQLVARTIAERSAAAANALEKTILDNTTASLNANTAASVTNTVATEGQAAATGLAATITNGFNLTLKNLYATMAANPYGAIIAALGLLVSAYVAFGGATEEQVEKQKTLNELLLESANAAQSELLKIKILTEIIKDNTSKQNERLGAYRELQKLVPELANLTLQEAEAQNILNDAITREITLIELRAKQKALESFIVQEEEKNIKKQQEQKDQYIKSLGVEIGQLEQRLYLEGYNSKQVGEQVNLLIQRKLATQDFKGVQEQLYDITKQIVAIEEEQNNTLEKTKKSTKDVNEVEKKRKEQQEALLKALAERLKLEAQLLAQTFPIQDLELKIVKSTQEKVDIAKQYSEVLNKQKTILELYNGVVSQLVENEDRLGSAFNGAQASAEQYFNLVKKGNITQKEANEAADILFVTFEKLKETYSLNAEESNAIDNLRRNYLSLFDIFRQYSNFNLTPPFQADEWEQAFIDYNLAIGKLTNDPSTIFDETIKGNRRRTQAETDFAIRNATKTYQALEESFIKSFISIQQQVDKEAGFTDEIIQQSTDKYKEAGKLAFSNLEKTGGEILKFEQGVYLVNQQVISLNKQLIELAPAARRGFLVENMDQIVDEYSVLTRGIVKSRESLNSLEEKLRTKNFQEEEKYKEALLYLQTNLEAQGFDIKELSYEEKLQLLQKYLKKEVEATDKAEKTKQQKTEDTLNGIMKGIQMFSSFVGEASSLYQQKISFELAQLEKSSKATLEQVVGDTEEANNKRLELTKQYETQKAALEKQALIKSLQAQKVQAISALALALLQTYKDFGFTPPGFIAAGIGTALAGYQIALIQDQINTAQSLAGGGMIFGLPHEMGGVNAAGGINLEGGESVINRVSTVKYQNLLSNVNQMGGGKPIINNAQNGLMEERLLQAIAKTNNEPLRAYVLNSDITSGQALNKRLSQLATI